MPLLHTIKKIFGGRILTEDAGTVSSYMVEFKVKGEERNPRRVPLATKELIKHSPVSAWEGAKKWLEANYTGAKLVSVSGLTRDASSDELQRLERLLEQAKRLGDSNEVKELEQAIEEVKKAQSKDGILQDFTNFLMEPTEKAASGDSAVAFSSEEAQEIAAKAGVDLTKYDLGEFCRGLEVELEHSDLTAGDPSMTAKIVVAHLNEIPDYYTRLGKMEAGAKTKDAADFVDKKYKGYQIVGYASDHYFIIRGPQGFACGTASSEEEAKKEIDKKVGTKDSAKQRFRDRLKRFKDAKSDYITAVDPNGKKMEIGESMANALVKSGAGRWSEAHQKVILNKPLDKKTMDLMRVKDGGVGSGIKGHITPKQIEAYGVKGMKSTQWRKVFKNQKEFENWLDKNEGDVEVYGTRTVDALSDFDRKQKERGKIYKIILPAGMGEPLYTGSAQAALEMAKEYGKGTRVENLSETTDALITKDADYGERYKISVTVSGGVTGTRTAWLKDGKGVLVFGSKAEADAKAAEYRSSMNRGYGSASYSATVVKDGGMDYDQYQRMKKEQLDDLKYAQEKGDKELEKRARATLAMIAQDWKESKDSAFKRFKDKLAVWKTKDSKQVGTYKGFNLYHVDTYSDGEKLYQGVDGDKIVRGKSLEEIKEKIDQSSRMNDKKACVRDAVRRLRYKGTTDGGVGSGIKGHVTAKQIAAMKARKEAQSAQKPSAKKGGLSAKGIEGLKKNAVSTKTVFVQFDKRTNSFTQMRPEKGQDDKTGTLTWHQVNFYKSSDEKIKPLDLSHVNRAHGNGGILLRSKNEGKNVLGLVEIVKEKKQIRSLR